MGLRFRRAPEIGCRLKVITHSQWAPNGALLDSGSGLVRLVKYDALATAIAVNELDAGAF